MSDIQQLQVLSHQSKIATRIEIFVGTAVEGDPRPAYSRAKFKRMGYVSLDPNERSNFQARELKTVQFNANGLFLKLIIHKCSVNRLNIYSQATPPTPAPHNLLWNTRTICFVPDQTVYTLFSSQVGLIAINVIGSAASLGAAAASSAAAASVASGGISPLDDLTFDLNFDPVTAKVCKRFICDFCAPHDACSTSASFMLPRSVPSPTKTMMPPNRCGMQLSS